jgi:hypothetical protein
MKREEGPSMTTDHTPYQVTLRRLGAYLDARAASNVHLLEAPGGFHLQFRDGDTQVLVEQDVSVEKLMALTAERDDRRRRRIVKMRANRATTREQYEDVFRALGYELEQAGAYSILVAEVEGGFLVTYQYMDAARGYLVRKHHTVVGPAGKTAMLQAAVARRTSSGSLRALLAS